MNLTMENLKGAINALGRGMPAESREALDALAATPELAALLQREDEALQARRRAMVADLADLPKRLKGQMERAAKDQAAAQQAVRDAERALNTARERASLVQMVFVGSNFALQSGTGRIEAELDSTADPRLQRLIDHCHLLLQATRDVSWSITWQEGRTLSGNPAMKFETNAGQVTAARAEVVRIQGELAALKRRPLLRQQVTAELKSLLLELDAAVAGFDLSLARLGDMNDLVLDDHKGARELSERAQAASRRASDSETGELA